jgi:hypothetical protein
MALALTGNAESSLPGNVNSNYSQLVKAWEQRAIHHTGGRLGYTHHTIEHMFHGRKENRGYETRWKMFLDHDFNPTTDVKRNRWGVLEFAGNKPKLQHEWDLYMRQRNEDTNSLS